MDLTGWNWDSCCNAETNVGSEQWPTNYCKPVSGRIYWECTALEINPG